jgi:hypothetical protein
VLCPPAAVVVCPLLPVVELCPLPVVAEAGLIPAPTPLPVPELDELPLPDLDEPLLLAFFGVPPPALPRGTLYSLLDGLPCWTSTPSLPDCAPAGAPKPNPTTTMTATAAVRRMAATIPILTAGSRKW